MEFEFQEDTDICLSKKPVNSLQFVKSSDCCENKKFSWKNKVEKFGISGSKSLVVIDEGYVDHRRSITDLPPALVLEILNCLDPKDLGIVSCVSTTLHKVASDHYAWKNFYCERWGFPIGEANEKTWKELFVERDFRSRTFLGQYIPDLLSGHTDAVRTVFLLASEKLIFTSGYDSVVRVWDMEEGMSISASRPLGCTIRAVSADKKLLVAGGTDGFIQCWKAVVDGVPHLFDLQAKNSEFRLWEHEGPITCLALDVNKMYSGSWDMTVRLWDRVLFSCVMVLRHSDWILSIAPHNNTVASSSGSDVYMWDTTCDGTLSAIIPHAHVGNTNALKMSHSGDFLFTGGEDGSIHMFEISDGAFKVATWVPHSGPVNCLAFEFPWLVSASSDGNLALIDVRKLLKVSRMKKRNRRATIEPPQRMLHGFGSSLFSVDIGGDRIVCGGEERIVKVWDFSRALEREMRSRAQKAIRSENRMREKCSSAAKNTIIGDRNGVWQNKRNVTGKVKS